MSFSRDLTGKTFGRLFVLEFKFHRKGKSYWLCRCECGRETTVSAGNLRSGHTQSCGCLRNEETSRRRLKHGRADSRLYNIWRAMIQRCHKPDSHAYDDYGARGITVCKRWRSSFQNFLADVGEPPTARHSLDRVDNDKGYLPANCKWATRHTQARNKRSNHLVTFDGETKCLTEWAETTGLKQSTIRERLRRGWPVERALAPRV